MLLSTFRRSMGLTPMPNPNHGFEEVEMPTSFTVATSSSGSNEVAQPIDHSLRYPGTFDTNIRLSGTFIRVDDKPAYIEGITDDNKISVCVLSKLVTSPAGVVIDIETRSLKVSPNDVKRVDITTRPLGFVSSLFLNDTGYLMRHPTKSQRQGTCRQNSRLFIPQGTMSHYYGFNLNNVFGDVRTIMATMEGLYVPMELATTMLKNGGCRSVAVDKNIAMFQSNGDRKRNRPKGSRKAVVCFRTSIVGIFDPNQKKVLLEDDLDTRMQTALFEFFTNNHISITTLNLPQFNSNAGEFEDA